MRDWTALSEELDRWRRAGRMATLWWRDDDSKQADPGITSLLALRRTLDVPLAIAAIPNATDQHFAAAVAEQSDVCVLQHGVTHRNCAPAGQKKCELSSNRDKHAVFQELVAGRDRLYGLFGERFIPVLVPPWNRIHDAWIAELPKLGYRGLSRALPRPSEWAAPGLKLVNIHVDIINWRGNRRFVGTGHALQRLLAHLQARRQYGVDADEPTGLLTHHLVEDTDCWAFVAELISRTTGHPAVTWLDAQRAF